MTLQRRYTRLRRAARRVVLAWPGVDRYGPKRLTEFWRAMAQLARLAR